MVFQDPQSSLHPLYTVGNQITEAYRVHHSVSKEVAKKRALEMLDLVGIPNPIRRFKQYPHEFSGGMRQRAMIAMGLVNDPKLVIADEPTTALDVTVQAQILDLLNNLQRSSAPRIVLITHDLGVVAEMADDVLVMYAGRCVEYGTAEDVLARPRMPYTWGCSSRSRPSRPRTSGSPDQGSAAEPAEPAERMLVQPPLSVPGPGEGRALHHRPAGPAAGRRCRRAHVTLPPARQGLDLRGRGRAETGLRRRDEQDNSFR